MLKLSKAKVLPIPQQNKKEKGKVRKTVISLLCIVSVWFVAIILFELLKRLSIQDAWLSFIWAIPVSFLLAIIFNAIWGKRLWTYIYSSFFSWTMILALYLQLINYTSFMIFIAGIPVQVVIILVAFLKRRPSNTTKALS